MSKSITVLEVLKSMKFNASTLYLFICNYNVIVLVWATLGTICSRRILDRSFSLDPPNSSNEVRTDFLSLFQYDSRCFGTLKSFSLSTLWVTIVALGFSISNQRKPTSIQEDGFNKPWRPLPSKRITPSQADTLLAVSTVLGFLFSVVYGGLIPYVIQLAASYHYNDFGGAQGHYVIRDGLNAVGMTSWLYGCIQVAGGPDLHFSKSDLITSVTLVIAIATTIAVQDLRDLDGDSKCGRATMPIVLGHRTTRSIVAASVLAWSFGTVFFMNARLFSGLTALGTVIAARVLLLQHRAADKITMEIWYSWFAALPLIMLQ